MARRHSSRKSSSHRRSSPSTPVGLTINQLAVGLMANDKSLNPQTAKDKAKGLVKASETLRHASGASSYKMVSAIFGQSLGRQISKLFVSGQKEAEAIELLADYKQKDREAERIPANDMREIIKRLDKIDTEVNALKIVRVAAPTAAVKPKPAAVRVTAETKELQNARQTLADPYFGLKKEDIERRLADAPEGASEEDLIKHALRDPSKKLPKTEVPAAVEAAKEEIASGPLEAPAIEAVAEPVADVTKPKEDIATPKKVEQRKKQINIQREMQQKARDENTFRKYLGKKLEDIDDAIKKSSWSILDWLIAAFAAGGLLGTLLNDKVIEPAREWMDEHIVSPIKDLLHKAGIGEGDAVDQTIDYSHNMGIATSEKEAKARGLMSWTDKTHGLETQHIIRGEDGKVAKGLHKTDVKKVQSNVKKTDGHNPIDPLISPTNALLAVMDRPLLMKKLAAEKKLHEQLQNVVDQKIDIAKKNSSAPSINVIAPKSPTILAPPTKTPSPSIVLKTRNDESSAASIVSDHFYHPVTHGRKGM